MAKHIKGAAVANASSYKLYLANGTELATQSTNVSAGIDFDLSTIAALTAAGTYSLGVKAISGDTTKFLDSLMSNMVSYTVSSSGGESTTLSPHSVATGFYLDSGSKYQVQSASSVVVYSVQPNSTYTLSVEKKSTGSASNANLIFAPAKSLNGLQAGGAPDFATGYSGRVVEMSTNETNVLNYQFTTPADCIYLLMSNYQSDSTHTVVGIPGTDTPDVPEGTDVALTKAVDGVYLGQKAKYTAESSSQVLCYAVSPNKTYVIGATSDPNKQLVVCCVKNIDNVAAENTAAFATGWSDRQVGEKGTNLEITTPADCTHLVFSNYLKGQAPSYVKLTN